MSAAAAVAALQGLPFYAKILLFSACGLGTGISLNIGSGRWFDNRRYIKWVVFGLASYALGVMLAFLISGGCTYDS